jgi:predicted glycosyltransferase
MRHLLFVWPWAAEAIRPYPRRVLDTHAFEFGHRPATTARRGTGQALTIWIDVENPPQVQYLLPFWRAFTGLGISTVLTARDYGSTLEMLRQAGAHAHSFGARVAGGKVRKVTASCVRALELIRFFRRRHRPDAVLATSRAASLAAWELRIPSFTVYDYEYANAMVSRFTRTTLLHPDVIDQSVFRRAVLPTPRLYPFKGLKEDLTFAGVNIDAVPPHDLGAIPEDAVRVLFRPPSETSHYYRTESSTFARETLAYLAAAGALVVFSPREREQTEMLDGLTWAHSPIILARPVPFVSLLKSVDLVISSGGTMLREGAYLGIPSYSIFQSEIGAVDRWLEQIGRAQLLTGPGDLGKIELRKRGALVRLDSNPELLDEIVGIITAAALVERRTPLRSRARAAA